MSGNKVNSTYSTTQLARSYKYSNIDLITPCNSYRGPSTLSSAPVSKEHHRGAPDSLVLTPGTVASSGQDKEKFLKRSSTVQADI